jgi:hypothetical protein
MNFIDDFSSDAECAKRKITVLEIIKYIELGRY